MRKLQDKTIRARVSIGSHEPFDSVKLAKSKESSQSVFLNIYLMEYHIRRYGKKSTRVYWGGCRERFSETLNSNRKSPHSSDGNSSKRRTFLHVMK